MDMNAIRQFNTEREPLEDLVVMLALGQLIMAEYEKLNIDEPDWLAPKVKAIRRQAQLTVRDQQEKRLAEAKMRLESLKTPQEKKAQLQKEINQLQRQMAEV